MYVHLEDKAKTNVKKTPFTYQFIYFLQNHQKLLGSGQNNRVSRETRNKHAFRKSILFA